jgi:non-homologous end joining protein Ku
VPEPEPVVVEQAMPDLMAALEASVTKAKKTKKKVAA